MELDLSFLKDVKVKPHETKTVAPVTVSKNPTEADMRVYANGSIYPRDAFVIKHNLEYTSKEGVSNGLDVFSSEDWAGVDLEKPLLFCAVVPKNLPKVSLWSKCTYDEKGEPKSSVMTQGANSFIKAEFMVLLTNAYGVDWSVTKYVDIKVAEEHKLVSPNGIVAVPKLVSRGVSKGELTAVIRKDIDVMPLVITHVEKVEDKADVSEAELAEADVKAETPFTPGNMDADAIREKLAEPVVEEEEEEEVIADFNDGLTEELPKEGELPTVENPFNIG